jgi:hypothetical protein
MITRLVTVGFTATELSRMSNTNLHATYLEARPLLEKNAAELARVVDRERKRGQRLKAEIAGEQANRAAVEEYHNWSQSNLPKPIVARRANMVGESMPQNPDVLFVQTELRKCRTELRERKEAFKRFGGEDNARKCRETCKKIAIWEQQMQEVGK